MLDGVFVEFRSNTNSRCPPSLLSPSGNAKTRTQILKILSSVIPAQVLRNKADGVELTAKAVTSPIESQQVDEIPAIPAYKT